MEIGPSVRLLEAFYDANTECISLRGNMSGLKYLQDLIDDLMKRGSNDSQHHLDRVLNTIQGNCDLILIFASAPRRSAAGLAPADFPKPPKVPEDLPDEILALVNKGLSIEAIRRLREIRSLSLLASMQIVSKLSEIHNAGLTIVRMREG